MIHAFTAFTSEIDRPETAVSDILSQLQLRTQLRAHAVGILTCYAEFLDSGVVSALCACLPFPVVGTTTKASGVHGAQGPLLLTLMVLTSDQADFSVALTGPLTGDPEQPIALTYQHAAHALGKRPMLALAFAPLIFHHPGDLFVSCLNNASGGVPVFGTLAVDHTDDYGESRVIYGGHAVRDAMAILLLGGDLSPTFYTAALAPEHFAEQREAVITAAQGNLLVAVNGMPLSRYLETLGLASNGHVSAGVNTIPFLVDDHAGGKPFVRALFAITPEGYGVCGGSMPVGATLSLGGMDRRVVLSTAQALIREVLATPPRALLGFTCIARHLALGADALAELHLLAQELPASLPYLICYSGGEICPMYTPGGATINRFHNNTLTLCAL